MALRTLGDGERLEAGFALDQDAAVRAHGETGAKRLLAGRRTRRDDDHFLGRASFPQANRGLDRDLAEGIHRHLDVIQLDARLIAFHPDFHIRVDDALDWYQDLHREALALNW